MTYTGIASTTDVDLDKDRIVSWDMVPGQKYKKPMFWQHDTYSAPVADGDVWVDTDPETNAPVLLISFDMYDTDDAEALTTAINNGAITSLSVGFSVSEKNYAPNEDGGYNFWNAHLTEVSIVLNPANPNAIIDKKMVASKSEEGKKDIFVKMSTSFAAKTIKKSLDKPEGEPDPEADVPSTEKTSSEPDETRVTDDQEKKSADQEPNEVASLQKTVDELKKSIENLKSVAKSEKGDTMETKNKDVDDARTTETHVNAKFKSVSETNTYKEPTKMAKFNVMKKMAEEINNRINSGSNDTIKLSSIIDKSYSDLNITKSVEGADKVFPDPVDYGIVADYQDQTTLLEGSPVRPTSTLKSIVFDTTDVRADALSRANGDEAKVESIIELQSRITNPGEVYSYIQLDYADLKQDTNGRLVPFLVATLDRKVREGAEKQALIGNPSLKQNNVSIDQYIRPIAKDDALYTAQTSASELSIANIDASLAKIKAPGKVIIYANRSTYSKLKSEKATDGHYLLADSTMAKLSDHFDGAELRTVEYLEDGEVVALAAGTYEFASVDGGSLDYFEDYRIDFNKKQFEKVTMLAGALTHFNAAVHFVVDSSAPASL